MAAITGAQPQTTQPGNQSSGRVAFPPLSMSRDEVWLIGGFIAIAMAALAIGLLLGPAQTYRRAPALQWEIPVFSYYYQALTLHGVLNALVFTTFFIVGASFFVTQRSLERKLNPTLAWTSFWLMLVGLLLAAYALLTGQANVLYTAYLPMLAHWTFYLGLVLIVVGSWVGAAAIFIEYMAWRREHPGERSPLAVFAIVANFIMWITASSGVAVMILTMALPLSLGIIATTDPQVSRILFWFFGHPLVYFWLIPAYVSWYTMLPKQLGVRLFSDTFGRVSFLMIMIFSIPIGVHHLFADPGVSETFKALHSFFTFVVVIPSLLTAFNIGATLERAGRRNGGRGLFGWITALPWGNPVVVGQLCGMLLFVVGGLTGMLNASYSLNVALHNTTWVVGHFHMTLAGAVFLTYMAILYWLLPMMRGRELFGGNKLALAQVYTWFVGMFLFGLSMGRAGLEGATRRTDLGAANYISDAWVGWMNLTAVAGTILLVSTILLLVVSIGTLFYSKKELQVEPPISTDAPDEAPMWLENWGLWVKIIIVTNVLMWGPVLITSLNFTEGFWAVPFGMQ